MKKSSLTHPLEIAVLLVEPALGRIGITFCPGKYDRPSAGDEWDRDLTCDLDRIQKWGAAAVITLLEPKELRLLRVEPLEQEVLRRRMRWFHLPIVDYSLPDRGFEEQWAEAGPDIRALLRQRHDIVVHCRGGLGRSGMIAARLLIEFGMEPAAAIRHIRTVRPGAIETPEQEDYVRSLRPCAAVKL